MYTLDLTDFAIAVPDHELADLRHRLSNTRRPRPWPEQAWGAVARSTSFMPQTTRCQQWTQASHPRPRGPHRGHRTPMASESPYS